MLNIFILLVTIVLWQSSTVWKNSAPSAQIWQEAIEEVMEETAEEAVEEAVHYHHHYYHHHHHHEQQQQQLMMLTLHSLWKSLRNHHLSTNMNQWYKMRQKCAWQQHLGPSTKMKSPMYPTWVTISFPTTSSKNGRVNQQVCTRQLQQWQNKRDKRVPHSTIFGHLLLHGHCLTFCKKRLLGAGLDMTGPSSHIGDEQGYVWIYF